MRRKRISGVNEEDVEVYAEIISSRIEAVVPMIHSMKRRYVAQSATERVTCPVCGGTLTMSIAAYNGHVWGKCSTAGCLKWME